MATDVYYSVGQNTTDHKTGSPTVTIASGVATFSVAQTATNMGVGDRVTHAGGDTLCYLKSKISLTQWNVCSKLGANPTDVTGQSVTSIAHEYASLSAAEAGASDANHINNTDLTAADVVLNIPCYYDSATDSTGVTINGWTGDATRFIKIYTPNNLSTECNASQRHDGKWKSTAYNLTNSTVQPFIIDDDCVTKIVGLQIAGTGYESVRMVTTAGGTTEMSFCLVNGNNDGVGVRIAHTLKIWNCILYTTGGASTECLHGELDNAVIYAYNCTCYISDNAAAFGILANNSSDVICKNCIVYTASGGVVVDFYANTGLGSTMVCTNCASSDDTADDWGGSGNRVGQTFSFVSAGTDFHLLSSDTGALIYGTDLSGDATIPFNTDIDGSIRPTPWSIGADQLSVPVYMRNRLEQKMS